MCARVCMSVCVCVSLNYSIHLFCYSLFVLGKKHGMFCSDSLQKTSDNSLYNCTRDDCWSGASVGTQRSSHTSKGQLTSAASSSATSLAVKLVKVKNNPDSLTAVTVSHFTAVSCIEQKQNPQ